MILTPAQSEALLQEIENALSTMVAETNNAITRIEHDSSWIPLMGPMITSGLEKFRSLVQEFVDKVEYQLTSLKVPGFMGQCSGTWLAIADQAGEVASGIAGLNQWYGGEWQGIAGGAYQNGVTSQRPAADAIQARANSISSACHSLEQTGYAFYLAVLAIIVGVIVASGGWGTVFPAVGGIITALLGFATAMATFILGIEGVAISFEQLLEPADTLPGGDWPLATSS